MLGSMTVRIKWGSTVYIAPTKIVFGSGAGTVHGVVTDTLSFSPGTVSGSFAGTGASLTLVTNLPAPDGACPNSPVFSLFSLSGGVSL